MLRGSTSHRIQTYSARSDSEIPFFSLNSGLRNRPIRRLLGLLVIDQFCSRWLLDFLIVSQVSLLFFFYLQGLWGFFVSNDQDKHTAWATDDRIWHSRTRLHGSKLGIRQIHAILMKTKMELVVVIFLSCLTLTTADQILVSKKELSVDIGRSVYLRKDDLVFRDTSKKSECRVEVVQNDPITQRVGRLEPMVSKPFVVSFAYWSYKINDGQIL